MIADNALALKGGWDRETLAIELQSLIAIDFDMELTGFELGEIQVFLDEAAEKTPDADRAEDALPDDKGPVVSRAGDMWRLGHHLLVCGDALAPSTYEAVLGNGKADVALTDPPYNVPIEGHVSGLGAVKHREFAFASGEMSELEFEDSPISKGLIQSVREQNINVEAIKPTTDKCARVIAQTDLFAGGSITFQAGAPWLPDLRAELLAFPGGKHDDQVDALIQGIAYGREAKWSFIVVQPLLGMY